MAVDNFLYFPAGATGGLLSDKAKKPEGESTDGDMGNSTQYKAIELIDFGFGVEQAQTTGSGSTGAGAGKAKFKEFTINKYVDWASVPLYNACVAGAHYPSVYLAIRKAGGDNLIYLQYGFRQVFVISIKWSGGGGEEAMKETIVFKYGAMALQYTAQKADGSPDVAIEDNWSTVTNNRTFVVPPMTDAPTWIKPKVSK